MADSAQNAAAARERRLRRRGEDRSPQLSWSGFPPAGHGVHHYQFVVHALDTDHLELDPGSTPAFLMFNLLSHTLGRGAIIATYEQN